MTPSPETLTSILNKLLAMHAVGFISFTNASKETGYHRQDLSQWISKRDHKPSGDSAIKIRNFCVKMTLQMAVGGGRKYQPSYRAAYLVACERFPEERE